MKTDEGLEKFDIRAPARSWFDEWTVAHFAGGNAMGSAMSPRLMVPLQALIFGCTLILSFNAAAQSMSEALSRARVKSASIEAARRDLEAAKERLPQAQSGYLPSLDLTGSAGVTNDFVQDEEGLSVNTNAALILTQPLYRSGGTIASVDQARLEIKAQEATLKDTEQSVLLETASVFMDTWRDQETLDVVNETLTLLTTERDSVKRQQELGAATRTDVAQTELRLAQTHADQIGAETSLAGSRNQFQRLTGEPPFRLQLPDLDPEAMPASPQEAVALAEAGNPGLKSATLQRLAAEKAVDVIVSNYRPSLDFRATAQYSSDDVQEGGSELDDDTAIARAELRLSVPLFAGGRASSTAREALAEALAEGHREEDLRRRVQSDARGAWTRIKSANEQLERLKQAVEAASRAAQGVEREYQLGRRTTLDLLDARQDLLDLQTTLLNVQRGLYVAHFDLLALTGKL